MDISFIIVSWNAKDYLRKCLASIQQHAAALATETIVVDNESGDGSPEMVESEFPWVRLIRSGGNLGFAGGNNVGIRAATGRYLALVNSDVELLLDCLEELMQFMENHPRVGLAGPRILNPDRSLQRSCRHRPTLWRAVCRALAIDDMFPRIAYPEHNAEEAVDTLSGCFWFARREAVEQIGGLDERFFMYSEDVDWCKRFRDAGWGCHYVPTAQAIHYGGASSGNAPVKFYIEMCRAQLQYWRKHYGRMGEAAFGMVMFAHQVIRWISRGLASLMVAPKEREALVHKRNRSLACLGWLLKGRP